MLRLGSRRRANTVLRPPPLQVLLRLLQHTATGNPFIHTDFQYCRSCITKWLKFPTSLSVCSHCRAKIDPLDLIKDVQCERASAAKLRGCPHAESGCQVLANRAGMKEHELVCEFVPRSQLRQERDAAIRDRELAVKKIEIKHQAANRSLRLQLQRLLMNSLGPSPAIDCLKTMFGFTSVIAINRDSIRNRSHVCMDAAWVRAACCCSQQP
jgi:hypothetical protein